MPFLEYEFRFKSTDSAGYPQPNTLSLLFKGQE